MLKQKREELMAKGTEVVEEVKESAKEQSEKGVGFIKRHGKKLAIGAGALLLGGLVGAVALSKKNSGEDEETDYNYEGESDIDESYEVETNEETTEEE